MKNKLNYLYYFLMIICIFLMVIYVISDIENFNFINKSILGVSLFALIVICCIIKLIHIRMSEIDEINNFYNSIRGSIIPARGRLISSDKIKNEKNTLNNTSDIIELMLINMKEIKEYYVLSKAMAKRSFLLAVIMCVLGFVMISATLIAIFVIDISFAQSIVPVIGGTIVEIIAGTALIVYKKSLEQLNQYYESLHNNERFLSLVNLVDKLTDDKKNETYINIINSQLEKLT